MDGITQTRRESNKIELTLNFVQHLKLHGGRGCLVWGPDPKGSTQCTLQGVIMVCVHISACYTSDHTKVHPACHQTHFHQTPRLYIQLHTFRYVHMDVHTYTQPTDSHRSSFMSAVWGHGWLGKWIIPEGQMIDCANLHGHNYDCGIACISG